jgi:valyl-tRNA synthetase
MELAQRYDPHEAEPRLEQMWQAKGLYKFNPHAKGEVYSVDTPPPTLSGKMHIGHSFSYAQQDYIVRYQRMIGKNVLYPFGTDDNGLPTERLVEKEMKIKSTHFSREEFRKICLEFVKKEQPEFIQDWIRLGMSCDFSNPYSTIDEHAQKTAQKSFIDLYQKKLVYRSETPVSWCPTCQTAIAQAEFENKDITSQFNDVAFSCGGKDLVIATTRPELIPACVALFANPNDKRYSSLKGKSAKVPIFDYEVPILFDEKVDIEKGTGLMMVCTFGDKDDVDKWYRYKLPIRVVFTRDGKMNELAPGYTGKTIKEARKEITEELKKAGKLLRQQPIIHPVNVHERCSTEIEFMKTPQWFIRVLDHKEKLLEAGDSIKWYPAHMKSRYTHWVDGLNWDWCISRQRFYGVPFPVWYNKDGKIIIANEDELPVDPLTRKPRGHEKEELSPEMDIMDTWNTSSVSPQIVLDWSSGKMKNYPMSLRPQAHDIIRTWAFYTITKGIYHQNKAPWKDIAISGHVLDPKGEKMSKSKGNAIAPQDVISKHSADALRFWAASSKLGEDLPFQEKDLVTGGKTINKLWNASRFVLMNLKDYTPEKAKLTLVDKWILSKLQKVIKASTENFEAYDYSRCKAETENFFWNTFCDEYLELVKDRMYEPGKYPEGDSGAKYTLYTALLSLLKLFAPIMPHVTEEVYQHHFAEHEKKESIHVSEWPKYDSKLIDEKAEKIVDALIPIISYVRTYKNKNQMSLKTELAEIVIECPKDIEEGFKQMERDILGVTKAKKMTFGKGTEELGNDTRINISP